MRRIRLIRITFVDLLIIQAQNLIVGLRWVVLVEHWNPRSIWREKSKRLVLPRDSWPNFRFAIHHRFRNQQEIRHVAQHVAQHGGQRTLLLIVVTIRLPFILFTSLKSILFVFLFICLLIRNDCFFSQNRPSPTRSPTRPPTYVIANLVQSSFMFQIPLD